MTGTKTKEGLSRHLPLALSSGGLSIMMIVGTLLFVHETGLSPWQAMANELEQRVEATEQSLDDIAIEQKIISRDVNDIEVKLGKLEQNQENFNRLQQRVLDRLEEIGPNR